MNHCFNSILITATLYCILIQSNCIAQEFKSPYQIGWGKESIVVGAGFVNGILASSFDDTVSVVTPLEIQQLDRNSVNILDRFATYNYSPTTAKASDICLGTILVAPFTLLAADNIRRDWDKLTVMYVETMLWSAMLPSYTKGTVQRIRPFAYNTDAPLDKKLDAETRRSFFSGHTCLAFSSAVFLSTVYSHYYPDSDNSLYVWGGSLIVAGSVGAFRVGAGAHFPTDVLVGAAIGSVVGYAIPWLHETTSSASGNTSFNITPFGASFRYQF